MSPVVIEINVVGDYEIEIFFECGMHGWIDIARMTNFEGVFSNLRNLSYFHTVKINSHDNTISWENGEHIKAHKLFMKISDDNMRIFAPTEMLKQPPINSLIYKIVKFENFIDMCTNKYLWLNNVTCYKDDTRDSDVPEPEKAIREKAIFEKKPNISLSDYDDYIRSNTYACCFTIKESHYIWKHYAKNPSKDLCLIFDLDKLITFFLRNYSKLYFLNNNILSTKNFDVKRGLVEYVDLDKCSTNSGDPHANLYDFAYKKDIMYKKENEFKITLHPNLVNFPDFNGRFLKISCDWNSLIECGALIKIKSRGKLSRTLIRIRQKLRPVSSD